MNDHQSQASPGGTDPYPDIVDLQATRLQPARNRPGPEDLEALAPPRGVCARTGTERPHGPHHLLCRLLEVESSLRYDQARSPGDHRFLLRHRLQRLSLQRTQVRGQQLGAAESETLRQRAGVLVLTDRGPPCRQDRSGVQTRVHPHQAHAGYIITGQNGSLDRRRPAPPRQQGEMQVDHAQPGAGQRGGSHDHPVAHHYGQVQIHRGDSCVQRSGGGGLADRNLLLGGSGLGGGRGGHPASTPRSVRSGYDGAHVGQSGEDVDRGNGLLRCPQQGSPHHSGARNASLRRARKSLLASGSVEAGQQKVALKVVYLVLQNPSQ